MSFIREVCTDLGATLRFRREYLVISYGYFHLKIARSAIERDDIRGIFNALMSLVKAQELRDADIIFLERCLTLEVGPPYFGNEL